MRIALVVPKLVSDVSANEEALHRWIERASQERAELVLFPEATLTGLVNNDDPSHDVRLGTAIPSPFTDELGRLCVEHQIWVAFGVLERDGTRLYDSAVLIDPSGVIRLKYRRIDSHWHGPNANKDVYCEGQEIGVATTPFGRTSFLICGDLFNDNAVSLLKTKEPDVLLYPFARCFSDGQADQALWEEELPYYQERVNLVCTPCLMVNYLADPSLVGDGSFGGAAVLSGSGEVLACLQVGREGMLLYDL